MGKFLHELQRRNVFRVAAAFLVVGWLVLQVVAAIESAAGLPDWADGITLIVLITAFPVVIFVSWAFELTPEGIKLTESERGESEAAVRVMDYVMFAAIIIFGGLIGWQQFSRAFPEDTAPETGDTVAVVSAEPEATPETTGAAEAGTEIASSPPDSLTVAVLPFLAMSSDEDDGYFADGLTEEILNSLAAVPDLRVTSRTSAFQFRGRDLPSIPVIADSLGVAHVLEGSVRRSGEQVRVTAQLIRATDDTHLWSQTYDRSLDNVFQIQEDIAVNVAAVLEVVLSDANRRQMQNSGTRNIDAFIAFQRGKELWDRAHEEDETDDLLREADVYFTRATELAPDFSDAYLMQSDWYAHQLAEPEGEADEAQLTAARNRQAELLQLAYDTAHTENRRAIVQANQMLFSGDWFFAREVMEDVFISEECANDNWMQDFAILYDNLDHRLSYAERQVRCDPLNPAMRLLYGNTLLNRGEYEQALDWAGDMAEREMTYEAEVVRFDALLALGRFDEAEAMLEEHWDWERIRLAAMRGEESAREIIMPFVTDAEEDWFTLALYALMGERDEANRIAGQLDAKAYGSIDLISSIELCRCGAPFDLEATPEFARRLAAGSFPWPPQGDIGFPASAASD